MVLRYIGYGTTDANGIAKLDHDPNGNEIDGYMGTGEGNITFVASTDASPSSSSVISNHVNVYDAPTRLSVVLSLSQSTVDVGDAVTLSATVTENNEPVVGETVTFKNGNTNLGSSVTNNSGVATYSYTTNIGGVLSITASCLGSNSLPQSLTVNKINTNLSINVPQMIYTDNFNITSVLLDENSEPIANADIKLYAKYQGVEHLEATETTDANGEVTFVRTTPTTISSYEFWVVFDGDDTYNNSISSKEQKSPGKETSVLTITSPLTNSSHYKPLDVSMGLNIIGTLKTNDGESIDLVGIDVLENGTKLSSLPVVNGTIDGYVQWNKLSAGSHTLDFVFNGNSVYTGTTQTVTVNILNQSITLTGDNPILSYADSTQQNPQICTVTATFNGINPTQQELAVYDENDVFIANMTNNGDGTYSYEYESHGVGDVELTVKDGIFLTKIFVVQDCWVYDDATSDKKSKYSYSNVSSLTHNTDHYEAVTTTSNGASNYYAPIYVTDMGDLPSDYEISLDYKITTNSTNQGGFNISDAHITTYSGTSELMIGGSDGRTGAYYRVNGSVTHYNTQTGLPRNTWITLYLKVQGTSATFTVKNGSTTLYSNTQTLSAISNWKKFNIIFGGVAQTGHFKNLKIKPL